MTIEEKARLFSKYNCLWLLRGILLFHKYAVSGLLLIFFGASFITTSDFYIDNFYEIDEGYFIYMLLYLFADAIIRDKCTWHYASIFGLLASSITNIAFQDDYGDTYTYYYSQAILGIFSLVSVILMLLDNSEDEIKIPKNANNQ